MPETIRMQILAYFVNLQPSQIPKILKMISWVATPLKLNIYTINSELNCPCPLPSKIYMYGHTHVQYVHMGNLFQYKRLHCAKGCQYIISPY